jgi:hypothetical protein
VPSQCGHGGVVLAGVTGNDSRGKGTLGERGGAPSLADFCQLAWSVIYGVFKLITAGFTRPYVSDAVVGKVLRPFWLAQARTALRTLICCYSFHRCFLHMCFLFGRHLEPKDDGDMKTRRSACIGIWIIRGAERVIGYKNSREDRLLRQWPFDQVNSVPGSAPRADRLPQGQIFRRGRRD